MIYFNYFFRAHSIIILELIKNTCKKAPHFNDLRMRTYALAASIGVILTAICIICFAVLMRCSASAAGVADAVNVGVRDVDVLTSPPIAATAPLEDLHLEPVLPPPLSPRPLPQQQQQRHDGGGAAWAAQALRLGGDWSALGPRRDVDAFTSPPIPAGSVAVPLPTSSSSDADAAPSTPSAAERPPQSGNCDVVVVQAVAVAMVRVDATPAPPADSSLVAPLSGRGVNHFLEPSSWKVTRIYTNCYIL